MGNLFKKPQKIQPPTRRANAPIIQSIDPRYVPSQVCSLDGYHTQACSTSDLYYDNLAARTAHEQLVNSRFLEKCEGAETYSLNNYPVCVRIDPFNGTAMVLSPGCCDPSHNWRDWTQAGQFVRIQ